MGGTVGFTLRSPTGAVHKMARWTNMLPWALVNEGFLSNDPEHTREILSLWEDMREDWGQNQATGDFRHNMTPAYAPHAGRMHPIGYGLVVADQQEKVLLDAQDYTNFDRVSAWAVANDLGQLKHLHDNPHLPDRLPDLTEDLNLGDLLRSGAGENVERFIQLFQAGRITKVRAQAPDGEDLEEYSLEDWTLEEIIERLQNNTGRPASTMKGLGTFYGFPLDMSPYKYETFQTHELADMRQMYERIQELGFELSDEDHQAWEEILQDLQQRQRESANTSQRGRSP